MPEKTTTSGVININKPAGITSHDVVAQVRHLLSSNTSHPKPKVGHTGTLDPFATGVLLVAIGSATRLIQFTHHWDKEYEATFTLGATSDTDDITGKITPHHPPTDSLSANQPSQTEIEKALKHFEGTIQQVPPAYSAVKIGGERLYKKARRNRDSGGGEIVHAPARSVTIHALELLRYEYPSLTVRITCSTGTYIRSLARDVGERLGTGAFVSSLQRTRIGPWEVKNAAPLSKLSTGITQFIHNPRELVSHLPKHTLTSHNINALQQGKRIPNEATDPVLPSQPIAIFNEKEELTSIAISDPTHTFLSPQINL